MKLTFLLFLVCFFKVLIVSCESEDDNGDDGSKNLLSIISHLDPRMFGKPSKLVGKLLKRWKPGKINPEEVGTYFEGDILIPESDLEKGNGQNGYARNGVVATSYRWPNKKIPFVIRGSFSKSERKLILSAMDEYHKNTCISFVKRTTERDYVSIESDASGCWSPIGRLGVGKQVVNLQSPGCVTVIGTAIHEFYHTAGFMHEQGREDRDSYVSIQWQNIEKGKANNFDKAKKGTTTTYGVDYNYGSVMHYSAYAFSKNDYPTIKALKSGGNIMGQRKGFATTDIQKINKMYNCLK